MEYLVILAWKAISGLVSRKLYFQVEVHPPPTGKNNWVEEISFQFLQWMKDFRISTGVNALCPFQASFRYVDGFQWRELLQPGQYLESITVQFEDSRPTATLPFHQKLFSGYLIGRRLGSMPATAPSGVGGWWSNGRSAKEAVRKWNNLNGFSVIDN